MTDWQMKQAEDAVRLFISHSSDERTPSMGVNLAAGENIYTYLVLLFGMGVLNVTLYQYEKGLSIERAFS